MGETSGGLTTMTYVVTGLTCGHCAQAVTEEITALGGVSNVWVHVVPGGESTVTVSSAEVLDESAVASAVAEAGDYRLIGARPPGEPNPGGAG